MGLNHLTFVQYLATVQEHPINHYHYLHYSPFQETSLLTVIPLPPLLPLLRKKVILVLHSCWWSINNITATNAWDKRNHKEIARKDDNKPKLLRQRQKIKQHYSHYAIQHSKIMRTGWHEQLKWSCRWATTSIPSTQEAVFCHVCPRGILFLWLRMLL